MVCQKFSFGYSISTQPSSTACKYHHKITSRGNRKFVAYAPCLKCHVHNKLHITWLRRVHLGVGYLPCIINLLIAIVGNVLMRLVRQGKGLKILVGNNFFSNQETVIVNTILVPGNSFLFWWTSFKKDTKFYYLDLMHRLCTRLSFDFNFIANANPYTS